MSPLIEFLRRRWFKITVLLHSQIFISSDQNWSENSVALWTDIWDGSRLFYLFLFPLLRVSTVPVFFIFSWLSNLHPLQTLAFSAHLNHLLHIFLSSVVWWGDRVVFCDGDLYRKWCGCKPVKMVRSRLAFILSQ